jgi:hypothetical protein
MTNFKRDSKGVSYVSRQLQGQSVRHTGANGLFRRSLATRAARNGSKGSGAPSALRALLAVLALAIAVFALTAASAGADDPMPTVQFASTPTASYSTVTASFTVEGGGQINQLYLEVSTDNSNWQRGASFNTQDHSGTLEVTGLRGGTHYFVRISAQNFEKQNGFVPTPEPNPEVTTLPVTPPSVLSVDNATDLGYTTATVGGEIERPANPDHAFDAICRFEFITDQEFIANEVAGQPPFKGATQKLCDQSPVEAAGGAPVQEPVTAALSGLASATTYHLRLAAENAGGTVTLQAASTFLTLTAPTPTLTLDPASAISYSTVHLSGTVDPEGSAIDPATGEPVPLHWELQYVHDPGSEDWAVAGAGDIAGLEAEESAAIPVSADPSFAVNTSYDFRLAVFYAGRTYLSAEPNPSFEGLPVA